MPWDFSIIALVPASKLDHLYYMHESSEGSSSTTNPKPVPAKARLYILCKRQSHSLRCLAIKTRVLGMYLIILLSHPKWHQFSTHPQPHKPTKLPQSCMKHCGVQYTTKMMQRKALASHMAECPRRKAVCGYCGSTGVYQCVATRHMEECTRLQVLCPNEGCREMVVHLDLPQHRGECLYEEVPCRYETLGCTYVTRYGKIDHSR